MVSLEPFFVGDSLSKLDKNDAKQTSQEKQKIKIKNIFQVKGRSSFFFAIVHFDPR